MLARIVLCLTLGHSLLCNAWLFKGKCFPEMYKDFQCYRLGYPYINTPFHYPRSPRRQQILFELYTPRNRQSPQLLRALDVASVRKSSFSASEKVAFVIHGFTDSSRKQWVLDMVDKLLTVVPNVIAVDWKEGAKPPNYIRAAANTRVVGAHIATLIKTLGVDPANVHLIGHSLGAHVAGYAGEKFGHSSFSRTKIGRITGLDPASQLFERFDKRVKLDANDAAFVDVIHTDAPVIVGGFGVKKKAGHVDFYPNGGSRMPGCKNKIVSLITLNDIRDSIPCSHNRAPEYFIASISDNDFTAYHCRSRHRWRSCTSCSQDGCNRMGYHATPQPAGLFVLGTGSSYPF
ncbi:pancreatic lipase-related protein 2-like [Littorina saxatilis]|uniref:Lipase domain-containing protein n=1 Tax=Littorina saxatilis TaxID=31220 RepID=A0AAN9GQ03_9CAEN